MMNTVEALASFDLLQGLPASALKQLAKMSRSVDLACGEWLYKEGDQPDYCYLLVRGRLRLSHDGELLGYVARLQPVGEMGALLEKPREASVQAVRDSQVLCLPSSDFITFLRKHADTLLALSRLMLGRVREQERQRRAAATASQGIFVVIPAAASVPSLELAARLTQQLSGWPSARMVSAAHVDAALGPGTAAAAVDDESVNQRLREWLNQLEGAHRYLILVAEKPQDAWASKCLRLADRILVLAEASSKPQRLVALDHVAHVAAPIELVLLRPTGDPSPDTLAWRQAASARSHYFLHPWASADLAALARQITGRGIGLVLGGGGARGFAHIGLAKALQQLDIPVDVLGGTSMGAFVSALMACGYDSVEMSQIARETFVSNNYLNDYSLSRVSLIRGRRFLDRLREIFAEQLIEELPRSYYCVSTNLTHGGALAHDSGPLANWVGTSMCVPGVAPPVAHEGQLLCDGGVVDNLPTDIMQGLERGSIIACSVSAQGDIRATGHGIGLPDPEALFNWSSDEPRPSFSEILLRTATLTSDTVIQRASIECADIFLHMPVQKFGMFHWQGLDQLIELGYRHAMEQLESRRDEIVSGPAQLI